MNRVFSVAREEFRHVVRDPYVLGGLLLGTVVMLMLILYAVSADIDHILIVVYDGDHTPQSRAYVQCFVNEKFLDVVCRARSAGKGIPYPVIGLIDTLILTAVGVLLFKVPFRGSLSSMMLSSALFLLANIGVSLVIASMLRTQMAALIVNGLIMLVPLSQSDIVTPLYTMTPDGRRQALMWPVTHCVVITRGLFLKGAGLESLEGHALYLLVSGLVLSGLAIWRFKKKLGRESWAKKLLRHIRQTTSHAGYWLQQQAQAA